MTAETLSPPPAASPAAPAAAQPSVPARAQGSGHRHGVHAPRRPVKVGASLLRMSLGGRLLLAVAALIPLWVAVALVVG